MIQQQGLVLCLGAVFTGSLIVGCSGKPPESAKQPVAESAADKEPEPGKSDAGTEAETGSRGQKVAGASKRPMIDDIPLDVWLENPIGESKKTGTVAPVEVQGTAPAAAAPATAVAAAPMPPAEAPKEASKPAADDWASIISLEDLQNETKQIRLDLQKHLASVVIYNGHYNNDIAPDGMVLSALAGIALVHPEKVSWKDHAAHVRDIAAEMSKKSKALGPKPYEETKKEFEKIDGLLSGNPPPDIGEASADIPFSEVVSRRGIMKRLQISSDTLRSNYQTEAALNKGFEEAAHTATVVAALCKVINTEGFQNADEKEYQDFARGLMEANLAMAKAAREKDFAAFSEANGKVGKFCGECHSAYQSN